MPPPKPFIPDHKPTNLEIGWLAGFFEGEGHFNTNGGRPRLSVVNTDTDVLERFFHLVGNAGTIRPMKGTPISVKLIYQWRTNSVAEAHYVTNLLYPHLSSRRRQKADEIIKLRPQRSPMFEGGTCINGHKMTPDNISRSGQNLTIVCKTCMNATRRRRYARRKLDTIA